MDMIDVRSSAINAVGHDQNTEQMCIEFQQGRTYTFCRVPRYIFDELLTARSKGDYYNRHIRDRYQC